MKLEAAAVPPIVPNDYRAGDLLIDVGVRRVTREGLDLKINGRSFDLLLALVRAAPNLVAARELMDRVWPGIIVSPETLFQRILLLRQGLGDSAENPRYIAAVRGHGYRMTAPVNSLVAAPMPAAAIADTPEPHRAGPAERRAPGASRRSRLVTTGALALVIAAAGIWWVDEHRRDTPVAAAGMAPQPLRRASSPIASSSVAVMPFANLTGDPTRDYLGDGIAEALITTLAQVPGLKVPARTSTFAYKGHNADIRQIAQDLGVATVLEGSVRSAGTRLRVDVRLVDAASGFQIWSQQYDRQSPDLFLLQDDLAAQTLQALQGYLKVSLPTPAMHPPGTRDVQAYDLYLQARGVLLTGPASAKRAIALLDQALARDPNFAGALAQRAGFIAMPATFGIGNPESINGADRDSRRALALNPDSADGHVTQMTVQAVRWRWREAEQSHRAAMIEGANDPYFRNYHSEFVLRPTGRLQQAESEMMVSYHLAPADGYTLHELVLTESALGHDAEAVRLVEVGRGLFGDSAPLDGEDALLYMRRALRMQHYPEAAQWAKRAFSDHLRATDGEQAMQLLCAALADPAQRPAARHALRGLVPHLLDSAEDLDRDKIFFVNALTMVADLDGAYDLLGRLLDRRLARTGSGGDDWIEVWRPEMLPFRQDPRFQAFVTRVKLTDYWTAYGPPDACDFKDGKLICH